MRYYFTTFALLLCLFSLQTAYAQSEEYGIASYYDDSFQDSKTASGEPYDKNKYTGAHKTLPFGTIVLVTRLDTKESVKIRINDRGPYIKGRIVELSRKAADKIGLVKAGVSKVKIEVLGSGVIPDDFASVDNPITTPTVVVDDPPASKRSNSDNDPLRTNVKVLSETNNNTPTEKPKAATATEKKGETPPAKKEATPEPPQAKDIAPMETAKRVRGKDFSTYDLYKVQLLRPERTGFGVQVASLTNYANAMRQIAELQEMWFNNILVSVEPGKDNEPVYKILLGPFPDRETAKSYEKDLKKKKKIDGFIVALDSIKY